jgi:ketosteroid isomerase-like protein
MKALLLIFTAILVVYSCTTKIDKEAVKKEIYQSEKDFEKMCAEKSVPEAFYFFADDSAVIHRQNDTLIKGKENIKTFYAKKNNKNATVNWTPDFIEVSDCGTLGYTYGKYVWKITGDSSKVTEYSGVFHTVWKKQKDNTWKYVWD